MEEIEKQILDLRDREQQLKREHDLYLKSQYDVQADIISNNRAIREAYARLEKLKAR